MISVPGVKLRAGKSMSPEEKAEEMHKRESEIFQRLQEEKERLRREAEAEAEKERIAWEEQGLFIFLSSSLSVLSFPNEFKASQGSFHP